MKEISEGYYLKRYIHIHIYKHTTIPFQVLLPYSTDSTTGTSGKYQNIFRRRDEVITALCQSSPGAVFQDPGLHPSKSPAIRQLVSRARQGSPEHLPSSRRKAIDRLLQGPAATWSGRVIYYASDKVSPPLINPHTRERVVADIWLGISPDARRKAADDLTRPTPSSTLRVVVPRSSQSLPHYS